MSCGYQLRILRAATAVKLSHIRNRQVKLKVTFITNRLKNTTKNFKLRRSSDEKFNKQIPLTMDRHCLEDNTHVQLKILQQLLKYYKLSQDSIHILTFGLYLNTQRLRHSTYRLGNQLCLNCRFFHPDI